MSSSDARVRIGVEVVDVSAVLGWVARPDAGALSVFVGTVRDENEGRVVTKLEYHAYESMAVREMDAIVRELESTHPGVRLAVWHRIGELLVGDVAVVCAASSPHRGEAFLACRQLIDEIKARVPIWKREYGPDGAYWVGWQDARCHGHEAHSHQHSESHHHGHG